jgi:dienelactone hydrolase
VIEYNLDVRTADGDMNTFVVRPQRGGPHPGVVTLIDAAGVRESWRDIARRGRAGVFGYCMSGGYVVTATASHADRLACGASFYGTRLMEQRPDAPRRRLGEAGAELNFAFAEVDSDAPLDQVAVF